MVFFKAKDKVHESERSGAQQGVSDPLSFIRKLLALQVPTETHCDICDTRAEQLNSIVMIVFHRRNTILARMETQSRYLWYSTFSVRQGCVLSFDLGQMSPSPETQAEGAVESSMGKTNQVRSMAKSQVRCFTHHDIS